MDMNARVWSALALCLFLAACGGGGGGGGNTSVPPPVVVVAYATWTASPQVVNEAQPGTPGPPPTILANQTVRQIAHLSAGGTKLRVKLSNLFGSGQIGRASCRERV